jgi:WD40 repeat protein
LSSLTFPADQRWLVSTGEGGTPLLHHTAASAPARVVTHDGGLSDAAFAPDGKRLALASYAGSASVRRLPGLSELARLEHSGAAHAKVAFTPNGATVATVSWDGTIAPWDAEGGARLGTLNTGVEKVRTLALPGDSERLVAGGASGKLELWNPNSGARLAEYEGHSGGIYQMAVHPAVGLVLSASNDGTARLWALETGK